MTVYQARVYDALRWVAQEATALKMTGHALPDGSRLREALAALTEAYAASADDGDERAMAALRDAAVRALPLLCRLGDFIGNGPVDPYNPDSLGERCDVIGALRGALAALGVPEGEMAPTRAATADRTALVRERMSALDAALRVVLDAAEAAIDAHPGLTRAMRDVPDFVAADYTAEVSRCRLGYTVACQVYSATNKRTRTPTRITGFGETLADAIVAFEGGLDAWAVVLK
jgi:predicted metal-dependent phosphoesterase TrpH